MTAIVIDLGAALPSMRVPGTAAIVLGGGAPSSPTNLSLREDGGVALREDGDKELREDG